VDVVYPPKQERALRRLIDVVKGIAQVAGRDEALTGSNRTMIGVVQGAIIETRDCWKTELGGGCVWQVCGELKPRLQARQLSHCESVCCSLFLEKVFRLASSRYSAHNRALSHARSVPYSQ
jgi:hypothetical protein